MKRFLALLVTGLFFAANISYAQSQTAAGGASEASINELLAVTKARKLIDDMLPQLQGMMKNAMQQTLQGQPPTKEQQAILDKFLNNVTATYAKEMSWEKMQPIYVRVYRTSFTQSEIDSMLAFYKSPGGRAVTDKMPVVMRNTMTEMQSMMGPMMKGLQADAEKMARELREQKK
jgi:hypothetical protein